MPENTLLRPSCTNSGKIEEIRHKKSEKVIFSTLKNQVFGTYLSKTITLFGLKLREIVPWVQAFKSGAGIAFILFLRIFKAKHLKNGIFTPNEVH